MQQLRRTDRNRPHPRLHHQAFFQHGDADEAEHWHAPHGFPNGCIQHQENEPSGTALYLCGKPCQTHEETRGFGAPRKLNSLHGRG